MSKLEIAIFFLNKADKVTPTIAYAKNGMRLRYA
mgnify:CR=1 FL=1